jgi:hypothetical protein
MNPMREYVPHGAPGQEVKIAHPMLMQFKP